MTVSPLLAWILIGEFALTSLAITLAFLWIGRRRHSKRVESVEALLTRIQAQQAARVLGRTELLKSAGRMPAAAAQAAAEASVNAEKECFRSLLLPLLREEPDFCREWDQVLYRLSDGQFDALTQAAGEPPAVAESVEDLLAFEPDAPEDEFNPALTPPSDDDSPGEASQPGPPEDPGDAPTDESIMQALQEFGFAEAETAPAADHGGFFPTDDADGNAGDEFSPDRQAPMDAPEPAPPLSAPKTQEEIDAEVAAKLRELEAALNELAEPTDVPDVEDLTFGQDAEPMESTTSGEEAHADVLDVSDETTSVPGAEMPGSISEEVPLVPEDTQTAAESAAEPQQPAAPAPESEDAPPARKRAPRKSKPRGKKKQDPDATEDADSPNQPD